MRPHRRVSLLALAFFAAACLSTDPTGVPDPIDPADDSYHSSLNIRIADMTRLASGVYIQDVVVGTGTVAEANSRIQVFYSGFLTNGTRFDTNIGGTVREFALDSLIGGWRAGVPGMRVGGRRKLVVPSSLGYGVQGIPGVIPGNANLVFDIQLAGIRQ